MLSIEKSRHATKNGDNFSFLLLTNNYENYFCYVYVCAQVSARARKGQRVGFSGDKGSCELWELNPGPLLMQF